MSQTVNKPDDMRLYFELVGSPFVEKPLKRFSDEELLSAYELAFPNRIALLYLSLHRRPDWAPELEEKYQALKQGEEMTLSVIARLGATVNQWNPQEYVVFKSIKPYPATPNDTDIICLGKAPEYESLYQHLLQAGYLFHEWAPQQRTLYDSRGAGKIGKGKKGGTYYVDLYSDISTDYFAYMNKHRLRPFIVTKNIEGVPVKLLRPEPELAIVMFHSVFPERTFQLEHFYYPLYALREVEFDVELFLRFSRESGVAYAVKTQVALIARLHREYFGFVPEPLERIGLSLGANSREVLAFEKVGLATPYMFTPRTFWMAFLMKCNEWYSIRSLFVQAAKMLNPKFFLDVIRSIRLRLSEKGAYHLE